MSTDLGTAPIQTRPGPGRRLFRAVRVLAWILLFLWGCGILRYGAPFAAPGALANLGQLVLGVSWLTLALAMPRFHEQRPWRIASLTCLAAILLGWSLSAPSNDRDWILGHDRLPRIGFERSAEGEPRLVTIENVRNHRYLSPTEATEQYQTRTIDLQTVRDLDFIVIPFAKGWRGAAHTMLSFGFGEPGDDASAGGEPRLVISIEARRERGEEYAPLTGLFRRYEVCFVIADEQDALALRVDHYDLPVLVHRTRATPEQARKVFVALLEEAAERTERPAFYNTLFRNCTTGIVSAVARVLEESVPLDHRIVFPGYTDEIAYERGWLAAEGTLEEVRSAATVPSIEPHPDSLTWSTRLRRGR